MLTDYVILLNEIGITDHKEQETVINYLKSLVSIAIEENNKIKEITI